MDKKKTDILHRLLFEDRLTDVYAVLEGTAIPDLIDKIDEHEPVYACLRRGVDDLPHPLKTLPYLVRLDSRAAFTDWVLAEGLGKQYGIFAIVQEETPFINLRSHFRGMVRVSLDGDSVLFRYCLPHVWNLFLQICNQQQLRHIFHPVKRYVAVNTSGRENPPGVIEYSLEMGELRSNYL